MGKSNENGRPPRPRIMGILNVTPDSFSDGGLFAGLDAALAQGRRMAAEGADIIDVGGESTRPGHTPVDAATELDRILPVIDALAPELDVPLSVDTTKSAVAAEALKRGARMLNDQWALQRDPKMADVAAESGLQIVLMHNREAIDPEIDIIADIRAYFDRSLEIARKAGLGDSQIILDPGVGFGKTVEQNLACVARLGEIRALGFPVLLGVSRKSSIGKVLDKPVDQRLYGTLAMNAWGLREGADIIRVHDVAAHMDLVRMFEAIAAAGESTDD